MSPPLQPQAHLVYKGSEGLTSSGNQLLRLSTAGPRGLIFSQGPKRSLNLEEEAGALTRLYVFLSCAADYFLSRADRRH